MLDLLSTITALPLADVIVKADRLRGISEPEVLALMEVMREFGHTTPIIVRRTKTGFVLVDGRHRLEAAIRLCLPEIPVRCYAMTDEDARMLEASQNLIGGMSPLDDAVFLAAWKRAYLQKHPETAGGVAGALAKNGLQANSSSFAEVVAAKRAVSVRQIQKIAAAGDRLTSGDLVRLRQAKSPATLKDIEIIGKLGSAEERSYVVTALVDGTAKSAGKAWRAWKARETGVEPPVKSRVDDEFAALSKVWTRASRAAKKRFCLEFARDIWDVQNRGAALTNWSEAEDK